MRRVPFILSLSVFLALAASACAPAAPAPTAPEAQQPAPAQSKTLTIYSAREEALVAPIIDQFEAASGLDVKVKYGANPELVAAIMEEGQNSPADVFFATDAGALQTLAGSLAPLPKDVLDRVPSQMQAPDGRWVSISGRARVVVYNTNKLKESDLPDTIMAYTDPKWKGRIGWSPVNGSFQTFVTALRVSKGEEAAKQWVQGIVANNPKAYSNNTGIVEAVSKGEIDIGFVNHYYLFRFLAERGESFPARNYYFKNGDIGGMMLANGLAVLSTSKNQENAHKFASFLLSQVGQQYFTSKTYEYPLVTGVATSPLLPPLEQLKLYEIDQIKLGDTQGTLKLLRETGVLP
ncbi:MAG: iron ABC transporter substrate-binding protein [Chloroflexi bacterium]|nr:iron ABC transporter substrate-binding protein [Chloroflexota bacterium]